MSKTNHRGYSITTHTTGQNFGTHAVVRRGGFRAETETFGLGNDAAAIAAAKKIADEHAAKLDAREAAKVERANAPRFEAIGPVRGRCGHKHQTASAAEACAERDRRDCAGIGGGAYSDRVVREI